MLNDFLHFLRQNHEEFTQDDFEYILNDHDEWVVLSLKSSGWNGKYWMYPEFLPISKVEGLYNRLPEFSIMPSSSAYSEVGYSSHDFSIESSFNGDGGIPLFFCRHYYGYTKDRENYIEFNQLVTHLLDLHWVENKTAYCVVDESGDESEQIKIIKNDDLEIILMRRCALDKMLYLGD